jgi:hypothetical protein
MGVGYSSGGGTVMIDLDGRVDVDMEPITQVSFSECGVFDIVNFYFFIPHGTYL